MQKPEFRTRWLNTDESFSKLEAHAITDCLFGVSAHEKRNYSVTRAIRSICDKGLQEGIDAGLEKEISSTIAARIGRETAGVYIPTRWATRSGLDTKTGAAGGFSVGTQVSDLIELLRARTQVIRMGSTLLTGLQSNVAFPVQLTGSTGSWVQQNPGSDVADSDATFAQKAMSPRTYQSTTSYSRQLLAQSSIDVEGFVRNDLAEAHALAIDAAAINGSGLQAQPLGLLGTTGIGSVAIGTDGGVPTYAVMVDLETSVATANADAANMKFLTTPGVRGKLRKTETFASTNGMPVWTQQIGNPTGAGDVNGYEAWVSTQVPSTLTKGAGAGVGVCHAIIFGNFSEMLIAEWGLVEILTDPWAKKKAGMVEVTSFQMVDVLVRQPAAFSVCVDARLS